MARMTKLGAFALTEPDHGSDSSEPHIAMDCMASPAWTPRKTPRLPSPRCSSMVTRPHAIGLMPAQPYPVMSSPTMPSSGSRLTSGQQISARSRRADDRHDLVVDESPDGDET
jgi:hypothetical protein